MLSTALHAQKERTFYKHEIGVSHGLLPSAGIFTIDELHSFFNFPFLPYSKQEGRNESPILTYNFGSFNFAYQYHIAKMHSIGIGFLWLPRYAEFIYTPSPQITMPVQNRGWYHHISITVNYRVTYFNRKNIRLHSSLHTGITYTHKPNNISLDTINLYVWGSLRTDHNLVFPAIQIDFIGFEYGVKHVFCMDLGFGTQGIIKIGYQYRFNSLKNKLHPNRN
jgi:hypothetical protein